MHRIFCNNFCEWLLIFNICNIILLANLILHQNKMKCPNIKFSLKEDKEQSVSSLIASQRSSRLFQSVKSRLFDVRCMLLVYEIAVPFAVKCREILFAKLLIDECHARGGRDLAKSRLGFHLYNHLSLVSSSIMRYSNFIIASPGILITVSRVSVRMSMWNQMYSLPRHWT